jgi:hypothetical protein
MLALGPRVGMLLMLALGPRVGMLLLGVTVLG